MNHNRLSGLAFRAPLFFSRILSNRNLEELRIPFRYFFQRYIDEREDEPLKEEITNENFMEEKYMNFRLYPFYINWEKIEANESGYYRILVHFGYFGAAIFSSFKEKYSNLDVNNVLFVLAGFISEYLLNKENKTEEAKKTIEDFFEKMPNLNDICELIEKKIIMMKEVPMLILVLKINEINFIIQKNYNEVEKVLKYEYLLMTYLSEDEYKNIYNEHFRGKISKIFKKLVDTHGKNYNLPKTKVKYINHLKSIYKIIKQK